MRNRTEVESTLPMSSGGICITPLFQTFEGLITGLDYRPGCTRCIVDPHPTPRGRHDLYTPPRKGTETP